MKIHEDMTIAINGPKLVHSDAIVQDAIRDYFSDAKDPKNRAGHFTRRSQNIKDYSMAKCMDKLRNVKTEKHIIL